MSKNTLHFKPSKVAVGGGGGDSVGCLVLAKDPFKKEEIMKGGTQKKPGERDTQRERATLQ